MKILCRSRLIVTYTQLCTHSFNLNDILINLFIIIIFIYYTLSESTSPWLWGIVLVIEMLEFTLCHIHETEAL